MRITEKEIWDAFFLSDGMWCVDVGWCSPREENRAEVRALAKRYAARSHIIYVTAESGGIAQRLRDRLVIISV